MTALSVISSSIERGGKPERLTAAVTAPMSSGSCTVAADRFTATGMKWPARCQPAHSREGLFQYPIGELADHAGLLGEGDERVRNEQAASRVPPTHERLDATDSLGGGVDLRLIVETELPVVDRVRELACKLEAGNARALEVVAVAPYSTAVRFCLVHGDLGPVHESRHRQAGTALIDSGFGDAEARREAAVAPRPR